METEILAALVIVLLGSMALNGVMALYVFGSVPQSFFALYAAARPYAGDAANRTATPVDNKVLEFADDLVGYTPPTSDTFASDGASG